MLLCTRSKNRFYRGKEQGTKGGMNPREESSVRHSISLFCIIAYGLEQGRLRGRGTK